MNHLYYCLLFVGHFMKILNSLRVFSIPKSGGSSILKNQKLKVTSIVSWISHFKVKFRYQ